MPAMPLNAIAQSSAERLVNSAVEGLVLAALVWLVMRLLPRQNAGTRFSLWMAALLSIATLPLAEAAIRMERPMTSTLTPAAVTIPAAWGLWWFAAWAPVATVLLSRVALGVVQLRRLRAAAEEVNPAALDALSRKTLLEFQPRRSAALCVSDEVSVPTAVGLFRPAVLVPRWALSELSADDLNSVLVHELAHLKRRDDWTNLLQKLVRAVFFFHPAVWWIENRLSLEREMACDEHVLATQTNPRAYAECLVSLAERSLLHRAVVMAQGAVSRLRECSVRVAQILHGGRPRTAKASRFALIGAASGSVLMLVIFAQAPRLVAFSSASAAGAQVELAANLDDAPAMVPATWHSQDEAIARATPAAYVSKEGAPGQRKATHARPMLAATSRKAVVPPRMTTFQSAPGLYHTAAMRQPNAVPGTVVVVQQTAFYTDGRQVWQVSIYRMAVLQPVPPAAPHDFSRKAI
jgi:beta-lactamase regulating signal transducer with metallopeptidase domain